MNITQVFNTCIYYFSIFWILIIAFPNWNITKKVIGSYLPFIPWIIVYIYIFYTTTDLDSLKAILNPQLTEYANLYSQEDIAFAVTIHFLTLDLFVGRWIYLQGQEKKIWTIHSLILCLFFGPVGLLSHIITNYFYNKNAEPNEIESKVSIS